jgi:hypothetical protein
MSNYHSEKKLKSIPAFLKYLLAFNLAFICASRITHAGYYSKKGSRSNIPTGFARTPEPQRDSGRFYQGSCY